MEYTVFSFCKKVCRFSDVSDVVRATVLNFLYRFIEGQDNSINITKGYGLYGRSLILGSGKRFFSTPQRPDWLWNPSLQWVPGALSPEDKAAEA
jgi:hypothetical protein